MINLTVCNDFSNLNVALNLGLFWRFTQDTHKIDFFNRYLPKVLCKWIE